MQNTHNFRVTQSGCWPLPKAAARLVKEWALARQNQLREN
jgi:hypothetical protein